MSNLAQKLGEAMSPARLEEQATMQTVTRAYVAVEDSHDGVVLVNAGGEVISEDDQSVFVEMPIIGSAQAGDIVYGTAYGDGPRKVVILQGGEGSGDRQQADIAGLQSVIMQLQHGTLVCYPNATIGAFVNAAGEYDIVSLSWSNGVPTVTGSARAYFAESESGLGGGWLRCGVVGTYAEGPVAYYVINTDDADPITAALPGGGISKNLAGMYLKVGGDMAEDPGIQLKGSDKEIGYFKPPNTGWQYLVGDATTAYWTRWRCDNNHVFVELKYWDNGFNAMTASDVATSNVIPAAYRPSDNVGQMFATKLATSTTVVAGTVWVDATTGAVHVMGYGDSERVVVSFSYPVPHTVNT